MPEICHDTTTVPSIDLPLDLDVVRRMLLGKDHSPESVITIWTVMIDDEIEYPWRAADHRRDIDAPLILIVRADTGRMTIMIDAIGLIHRLPDGLMIPITIPIDIMIDTMFLDRHPEIADATRIAYARSTALGS